MSIVITNFKVKSVKQDSVPYMMKIILTHILTGCGVVDPNVYLFLKYPKWALDKIERKFTNRSQENSDIEGEPREEDSNSPSSNTIGRDPNKDKYNKGHIVIPYTKGLLWQ